LCGVRSIKIAERIRRERTIMNTILIIDDNIDLLEMLAAVIGTQLKGCNILTARNGLEAIASIDSMPVSLILTDLDMPVMDGYGVVKHRNKVCPHVPVFVMSGSLTPEIRERLGELRVSGCVEKPFYFEQIRGIIAYMLNVETIDDIKKQSPSVATSGRHYVRVNEHQHITHREHY
jgi:two-component system, chemotaxis family, chemotaxis protein CheY